MRLKTFQIYAATVPHPLPDNFLSEQLRRPQEAMFSAMSHCGDLLPILFVRCLCANSYLRVSQEDEDELRQLEMEQIAMENGSDL